MARSVEEFVRSRERGRAGVEGERESGEGRVCVCAQEKPEEETRQQQTSDQN